MDINNKIKSFNPNEAYRMIPPIEFTRKLQSYRRRTSMMGHFVLPGDLYAKLLTFSDLLATHHRQNPEPAAQLICQIHSLLIGQLDAQLEMTFAKLHIDKENENPHYRGCPPESPRSEEEMSEEDI